MEDPSSAPILRLPPATRPLRRLELPSGSVSYLALGSKNAARTVVFLHSFSGNILSWQYNISAIPGVRMIALDLPGHGGSDLPGTINGIEDLADWIATVLDALDVKKGHFVGHSLGGWAALALTRRHQRYVEALSLLSPAGMGRKLDIPLLRQLLASGNLNEIKRALAWLGSGSSNSLQNFENAALKQFSIPNARECLSEMLERVIAPAFVETLPPFDWSDIDAPTQVIWGVNDSVLAPPRHMHGLSTTLTFVQDAGHMIHLHQPAEVNRLLKEFAAKI